MKDDINEKKLTSKIKSAFSSLSQEAITHALILYYTLREPNTPAWVKTVILGTLGYFISLIDGIPDLTPVLGYTDDISVMAAAIATLSRYITPEIKAKAKHKTDAFFPAKKTDQKKTSTEAPPDKPEQ
ncbi:MULTISPECIES: YkvA family protein [unclassified Oleiphilus]|jgi:uncharacterized membrane protein YkvA (DUF1232 family)|uniref:YkvA family protein n=2 Tax=Oleiphilus TaxID=141450 RepID=UPI0007C36542|nr:MULTISPECIES: YkvA family protein [unclassified Oleiphilus]KZY46760.1 hypothetical protein A3732_00970 [Oleiphilus sp. HI0050]KZY83343.1 hypothetical protein A3741_00340 [Oleiphilus sp. HI0069]KZY84734.1 hypothetical protein A3740_00435 [Oleiphilus sp. HI0068]KZY89028.1 hypothetical protein A3743_09530 [Oleiphilus sp. HI0072]KZZ15699.1 hypothetical protein A3749_00505 [Oleiphilus sp. HI0078]KZZ21705.1 hypothetical protein A3752_08330 [Oleiphilus sp. HI0081]KZZ32489.1 hypothetical protein 